MAFGVWLGVCFGFRGQRTGFHEGQEAPYYAQNTRNVTSDRAIGDTKRARLITAPKPERWAVGKLQLLGGGLEDSHRRGRMLGSLGVSAPQG